MFTVPSHLSAVQVYARGATVFRTARLTVDGALPDEVELTDLPLSLIDPTARVRVVEADGEGADVVAAGVRVGLWVRPGDPPQKAPEREAVEDIARKLRRARAQHEQLEHELELLGSVGVPERPRGDETRAPPPSPMVARLQLEEFVDEAVTRRIAERRALAEEVRRLTEEEQRLQERIAASSTAAAVRQDDLRKSVVVRLRSRGAAPRAITLELSYVVPGARWAPAYQFRLARDGSTAELQMRAWVAQHTGEDWRGVRMRLSTASPLSFTELPELAAVKIGRAQPSPTKKGFRPPPTGGDALFRDFDRDRRRAHSLVPAPPGWQPPALEPALSGERTVDVLDARVASGRARAVSAGARRTGAKHDDSLYDDDMEPALAEADSGDAEMTLAGAPPPVRAESARMVARPAPFPSPAPAALSAAAPAGAPLAPAARKMASPKRGAADPSVPEDVLELVAYPLLRLPAADDARRGLLQPADLRSAYAESLARVGRTVSFDVMTAVHAAEERARAVTSVPLPDGALSLEGVSSHFDFAYAADGVVEVVGDGGFHSIALGTRSCDARMRYIAVPREELAVYRVAMLTNPEAAPLLTGPAEVYVGGEYVLTTRMPTVVPRGELKLGLGVEQGIKIARNARFEEVRSGEKVVAMTELVHHVDVDVVNHLERDIAIEVRERVPVPEPQAEVVVEEGPVEPLWQPYDQEERGQPIEGGRRWELTVPRGGAQRLRARYVLKIYANNELVGGNRREQ